MTAMTQFRIDGQPQPISGEPIVINLRLPFVGVTAHEIPLEMWQEANGWIDTEPGSLE